MKVVEENELLVLLSLKLYNRRNISIEIASPVLNPYGNCIQFSVRQLLCCCLCVLDSYARKNYINFLCVPFLCQEKSTFSITIENIFIYFVLVWIWTTRWSIVLQTNAKNNGLFLFMDVFLQFLLECYFYAENRLIFYNRCNLQLNIFPK